MSRFARILALGWLALGCGGPPGAVRADVQSYFARMRSWGPVEAETERTIERIFRTQFVDEAEVRRQIADDRPRALAHLERVRAYAPRSKDVQNIHARYVSAWEGLLAGYDAIERGFSSGDYTKLARGREAMERWRAGIADVAQQLRDLMDHVGVEPSGAVES